MIPDTVKRLEDLGLVTVDGGAKCIFMPEGFGQKKQKKKKKKKKKLTKE